MDKRFIAILAVLILGLGAIFIIGKNNDKTTNSQNSSSTVSNHIIPAITSTPSTAPTAAASESKNTTSKKVSLLVYGDFQCPICGEYYKIEKQVIEKFQNDLTFTFRHFPIDSIHQNARAASRAAEAAGLQGKFFEMHDVLYQNQSAWSTAGDPLIIFSSYATSLGLDENKFKTDFGSEVVNNTINADLKEGNSKGVSGTPTYFLNGKQLDNKDLGTVDSFSAKIQEAIDANK